MICIKIQEAQDLKSINLSSNPSKIKLSFQLKLGKQKFYSKKKSFSKNPKFHTQFYELEDDTKYDEVKLRLLVTNNGSDFLHSTASLPLSPLRSRPEGHSTLLLPLIPVVKHKKNSSPHPKTVESVDSIEPIEMGDEKGGEKEEEEERWGEVVVEAFYTQDLVEEESIANDILYYCGISLLASALEAMFSSDEEEEDDGESGRKSSEGVEERKEDPLSISLLPPPHPSSSDHRDRDDGFEDI